MKQPQREHYINESLRNATASNLTLTVKVKKIAEETGNTENHTYAEVKCTRGYYGIEKKCRMDNR